MQLLVVYFTHPSSLRQAATKMGKVMLKTRALKAKGKTSALEMGEPCYNIININVLVLVNLQIKLLKNSISCLSWYFIRPFSFSSYC